jgi:hypothetical protein
MSLLADCKSLESILPLLSDEWYESVEGVYDVVPTFGGNTG